jgi:predicted nucleic acid-binding protein
MSVIDASVYVALLKPDEPAHAASVNWMRSALENELEIVAPAIMLSEVAAAITRGVGDAELALRAAENLAKSELIQLRPVSVELGMRAAEIASQYKLRGCDAVYLALAETRNEPLVTLDQQQLERGSAVIEVVHPR